MKYLKTFESLHKSKKKSILMIHGYKSYPHPDKLDLLSNMGFSVYSPHIDYDLEWEKDKCKSIMNEMQYECVKRNIDYIMGTSLGGYAAFLLSNKLNTPAILINPAFVRDPNILDMPNFDFDYKITNPKTEVFSGELDELVLGSVVKQYLDNISYKYDFYTMKGVGHSFTPELFNIVLNMSKIIN
jgi:hypothetical protein